MERSGGTISAGSWLLALGIARQGLGLLLTIVLVRVLSTEEFGEYRFVLTAVSLCGVFTLQGYAGAITQSTARGHRGTYYASFGPVLVGSCVGVLFLIAAAYYMATGADSQIWIALLLAAALFPLSEGLTQWQAYLAGLESFRKTAIYQGISMVLTNLAMIGVALLPEPDPIAIVGLLYGVPAVMNIYYTMKIHRKDGAATRERAEDGALRYGLRTSILAALNTIGNSLDSLLLFTVLTPEALAVFSVANRIPELLKRNIQALRAVIIPKLSRTERYTATLDRRFNLLGCVNLVSLFFIAFCIVPWLLPLLFSAKFEEAVPFCQALLLTNAIGGFATAKYTFIVSRLDERSYRGIVIITNVVRIVCSLALVPWLGIAGAVLATLVYRMTTALTVNYYLRKYYPIHVAGKEQ